MTCSVCLGYGEVVDVGGHVLPVSPAQAALYQRVARRNMEREVKRIKAIGNEMGVSARDQIKAFALIRDVDAIAVPCPWCPEARS